MGNIPVRAQTVIEDSLILLMSDTGMPSVDILMSDLNQYIGQRLEYPTRMRKLPIARQHRRLQGDEHICSVGIARVELFEDKYQWLRQSARTSISIYTVRNNTAPPPDTGNSTPVLLVSRGMATEGYAKSQGWPHQPVTSVTQILEMLRRGRATHWLEFDFTVEVLMASNPDLELDVVETVQETPIWLACSRSVEPDIITALGQLWDQGLESGELRYLFQKAGVTKFMPPQMMHYPVSKTQSQ